MTNAEKIAEYKKLLDEGAITQEEYEMKKSEILGNKEFGLKDCGTIPARIANIIAYITWIGFLLALLLGDRDKCKFHLNQALVINLFSMLTFIPILGWIWGIIMFICFIIGLVSAINETEKQVPIIGGIKIIK